MKLTRLFFAGMTISFLGTLPLGTINLIILQLAITDGYNVSILFAFAFLLVEMLYVRISLVAMDFIMKQKRILKMMEWITFFIVIALAISSFIAAAKNDAHAKNVLLNHPSHPFLLGLFISAINPIPLPFWFGWSTILFTKKILLPKNNYYNIYTIAIGLGTLIGSCIFVFGGQLIAVKFGANQKIMNWTIGFIFAITAIIQLWRTIKPESAATTRKSLVEPETKK
ncbi:MAG: LysE family transporter [Chitinophagales bacterium]|nr:LysE family transporter [Chitinophagales bacterium]